MNKEQGPPIPGIGFGEWLKEIFGYFGLYDDKYLSLDDETKMTLIKEYESKSESTAKNGANDANYG